MRAYFRAKGGEIGGFAYRARIHRLFTELEPSITVTEQNLADRVRYILRSNIFDGAELERLRREIVPSSNENATTGGAVPQVAEQPAHVDAAENTPLVADSNDDGTFTQELEIEQMRSTLEEAIMETRSTPLENRPRLSRIALSKRNRAVVRALNPMLVTYLEASRDLCETDSILFGAALTVCRIIGAKLSTAGRTTGQSSAIPAWRTRIEERIAKARALIGRLICFRSGNTRPRIVRTVRMAFAGTNVSLSQPDIMQKLTERIDDLKQRIAAWGKRIRRYIERSTRFNQNRLFQSDQKRLYKSLERPMVSGTGPVPNQADTVAFWRSLWSEPVNHNEGPWTEVVASQCAGITPMDPVTITPDDVAEAVRRAPNWKSPGLDGLHHYWLKGFVVCHTVLARQFQEVFNQKSLPSLFTTGITHLVPKGQAALTRLKRFSFRSRMFILLLSVLPLALAEPPVGDSYLEVAQSSHDHGLHQQYLPPDHAAAFARSSTSSSYARSNQYPTRSATPFTQEYRPPSSKNSLSQEYGPPNSPSRLSLEYGTPVSRNSISQGYNAPSVKFSRGYDSQNSVSALYGAPTSRNSPSEIYATPSQSSLSSQYGVPDIRSPSEEYNAPSRRSSNRQTSSVQKYGVPRFHSNQSPSISQNYGTPSARSNQFSTTDAFKSSFGPQSLSQIKDIQNPSRTYGAPARSLPTQYGAPAVKDTDSYSQGFGRTLSTTYEAPASDQLRQYGASETRLADHKPAGIASLRSSGRYLPQEYDAKSARAAVPLEQYGTPQDALLGQGYGLSRSALEELLNQEPANYEFGYKVSDYASGSDFGHAENRQEDRAEGSYFVVLPDGTKQVVEYEADERGFKPRISIEPNEGPY
ncbi:unnamed protein product [Parnassius apollo]|uniref:(apollo) hypothetical protein n=1 Tax=Parnassius apollo TaxID=110799 RepID=A0A8S3WHZ5_PARAO|nr:unnamed protein product [Parnassius apollo]